jgi:hypothetical protein
VVPFDASGTGPKHRMRAMVLLSGLFGLLFAMHAAASLGGTYCPFCLKNYLAFFSPMGLIVLSIAGAHWLPSAGRARQAAALLLLLAVPWLFGHSLGQPFSRTVLEQIRPFQPTDAPGR